MEEERKAPEIKIDWVPLNDESAMPGTGAHAGKKMKDVPADYLIWCFDEGKCSKSVKAYVTDNLAVLRKQAGENNKLRYKRPEWEGGRIDYRPKRKK